MKPRLLDGCCGAGGATRGYQDAGFEVTGLDLYPQPNYVGDHFIQADLLDLTPDDLAGYQAAHFSPPCQRYSKAANIHGSSGSHPDLVRPTRDLLRASGIPWVMENVEGAPLENPFMLCGSMFGLGVKRHRLFESAQLILAPRCGSHRDWYVSVFGGRAVGRQHRVKDRLPGTRSQTWTKFDDELAVARAGMGIDWMTLDELSEAIPPSYTFFIGTQLLAVVERESVA